MKIGRNGQCWRFAVPTVRRNGNTGIGGCAGIGRGAVESDSGFKLLAAEVAVTGNAAFCALRTFRDGISDVGSALSTCSFGETIAWGGLVAAPRRAKKRGRRAPFPFRLRYRQNGWAVATRSLSRLSPVRRNRDAGAIGGWQEETGPHGPRFSSATWSGRSSVSAPRYDMYDRASSPG